MKLNIVIPAAGKGTRLEPLGHKPLIDIKGKPMIEWAVMLGDLGCETKFTYIIRKEFGNELRPLLKRLTPECNIVEIDYLTEGQVSSVLLAKPFINNDDPVITTNCDQYMEWDGKDFLKKVKGVDGASQTYDSQAVNGSYSEVKDGYVVRTAEKEVISPHAHTGLYYFAKGSDLIKYGEQMVKKDIRVNNEFYTCPVYNEMIADGKKIIIVPLPKDHRRIWRVGVPSELEEFYKDYDTYIAPRKL